MENASQDKKKRRTNPLAAMPADMQGRVPPHTRELEEAVLGGMMLERDKVDLVIDILSEKHFYVPENQVVFRAIRKLYEDGAGAIDLLTVNNALRNSGELELIGGSYYLAQLTNRVASAANIEFHSRILTQKFVQRELIRVSGEIAVDAYNDGADSFELLDDSERKLYEIKNAGLKRNFQDINTLIARALKTLDDRSKTENDGITGVASGFTDLDRITSGWQPSDLIILAARPAMGKTAFALSLVRNAAVDFGKSVMIFSLEMADVQLVNRLISGEAEIPGDKIRKSDLTEEEWGRLHDRTTRLGESRIFIDDTPQLSIFDLNAKCRRVHSQQGLDLVVVDYLQLLRHETKGQQGNREQEIAFISRSLKGLAKELNIPVIALAQLSREVEKRQNKRPQLSDLRESGSIEQDADMVMFLYRDQYYTKMGVGEPTRGQEPQFSAADQIDGLVEILIGKNRHGAVGTAYAKFVSPYSKFVDLAPEERLLIPREGDDQPPSPIFTTQTLPSKMNSDMAFGQNDYGDNPWGSSGNTGADIFVD
ncbi:MAG: replicative DNA helicase [Bacteroidetes bacterium]|nr:replicative DNA helicase [Bacteroidota bacterium]